MRGDPCACGCDGVVTSNHPQARYASPQCRKRDWARSHGVHTVVGESASNRRLSVAPCKPNAPGMGVRCYFASTEQADVVARELRLAAMHTVSPATADAITDAAERITRAADRQRLKLQTSLEFAA
jgi:hypothetical protein